ncbi:glycosyltransferase family 2 protein [Rhodoferax sp. UBA5149]|uniref:glycosyltransferase family 2 protein n=1 Tax=Rhodoferax sp. UBA5149 TaxID=1947379 RepID=UPI002601269D|nr:glycosyltransferase family 2 protein [Rhodoferax sp. UBA5149]
MLLSVIVITRNECANIADCLRSLDFADEVIVLDNASTDGTADIARGLGARVSVTHDWPGFGTQKNRALALAGGEWVLSIDADERVPPELAQQIRQVVAKGLGVAYEIPRLTQFCGRWIRHCGWTPDYVLRLFKRGAAHFSDDLVHERVVFRQGSPSRLTHPLLHYSYPTPSHYWRKLEQYSQAWARQRFESGQKTSMLRAGTAGVVAFLRSYFFRLGFLDGAMGFAVCTMQAQAAFGKYFALYCLNQKNDISPIPPSV